VLNDIFWDPNQKTLRPAWRVISLFSCDYLLLHTLKVMLYVGDTNWTLSPSSRFLSFCVSSACVVLAWKYFDRNKRNVDVFRYFGCECNKKGFWWALVSGSIYCSVVLLIINFAAYGFAIPTITWETPKFTWLFAWFAHSIHEEIQFRGYMLSTFKYSLYWKKELQEWKPILLSSLLFSLAHFGNPGATLVAMINLFVFGGLLCLVTLSTKSLGMAIGMHFSWNYLQMLFGFPISGVVVQDFQKAPSGSKYISGGEFGPEEGIVFLLCNLLAILFIANKIK